MRKYKSEELLKFLGFIKRENWYFRGDRSIARHSGWTVYGSGITVYFWDDEMFYDWIYGGGELYVKCGENTIVKFRV